MAISKFDLSELTASGVYPSVGTWYGDEQFPIEKLNTPVTPRENWELFFARKPFYWVPSTTYDSNFIYPDVIPDNVACGYGGGLDAFGVKWVPNPSNPFLPAFVEPGFILLEDIANWRNLTWPDPDSWDWEDSCKAYNEQLDKDKINVGIMLSGCWERLVSIMSFEGAALALVTDPDSVKAFLNELLKYNFKLLERLRRHYGCDLIVFHDDWAAQKAPFFSFDMAREFFVPHIKALVEKAHSLGMKFLHHSCGNVTGLVPLMIECGSDLWMFNFEAVKNELADTIAKYGDKILFDGTFGFAAPLPEEDEAFKAAVKDIYNIYARSGRCTVSIYEIRPREFDLRKFCYHCSREAEVS